jgi:non-ribosomal peptide synthase protein (TIGR01720 family)
VRGFSDIISAIRQTVSARHGVQAHTVILTPPGALPRIGPGKIGRAECRSRLVAGTLPVLLSAVLDLSSLHRHAKSGDEAPTPPRTPTERTLAAIWEQVLEVDGIGVHDVFADLGGDSLLSMQVLLGIKQAGLPVTPEDVYRHGTIAALADAIDARLIRGAPSSDRPPLVGSIPLTDHQRGLLRDNPDWAVVPILLTQMASSRVSLPASLMERAAKYLFFHHDALRMRCLKTARGWEARYLGHTPPGLFSTCDLSHLPPEMQRTQVAEEIRRVRAGIDIRGGLLFRLGLIHLGDARDLVVLCVHHVVSDLVSTQILIRDLDTLAFRLSQGNPPELPARSATITEWLTHARAFARSRAAQEAATYWSRAVAHQPTILPVDFPTEERSPARQTQVDAQLGLDDTSRLKEARRSGFGLSDAVHYALARALSEQARQSTVLFQTLTHARGPLSGTVDLSRTVGFLAVPFPVLLDVDPLAGITAIRAQMEEIPQRGTSFLILLENADKKVREQIRGPGGRPTIQLNYWGDTDRVFSALDVFRHDPNWEWKQSTGDRGRPSIPWHHDLDITVSIVEGDLGVEITYHERAYHAATVQRLADRMIDLLRQLAREAGT